MFTVSQLRSPTAFHFVPFVEDEKSLKFPDSPYFFIVLVIISFFKSDNFLCFCSFFMCRSHCTGTSFVSFFFYISSCFFYMSFLCCPYRLSLHASFNCGFYFLISVLSCVICAIYTALILFSFFCRLRIAILAFRFIPSHTSFIKCH